MKPKILIVGNAVVGSDILDLLGKQLELIKIDSSELLSNATNLNDVSALWIHFDTFLDKSFLNKISHIPYLISTTTGLTHISKEVQDHYGTKLISFNHFDSMGNEYVIRIFIRVKHEHLINCAVFHKNVILDN